MHRIGGYRRKTRHKMQKARRKTGKINLRRLMQKFNNGDKVMLIADTFYQRGIYHGRFHSKIGVISGSQGGCYKVKVRDGNMDKTFIIHPVHLRRA